MNATNTTNTTDATKTKMMKQTADEQAALWNGVAGHTWVDAQAVLEQMYKPLEALLVDPIPAGSGLSVLDVGCGTGSTTFAAAERIGSSGRSIGVDISGPMIAAARARAERDRLSAEFIVADAQKYAFEPESFDVIMSRFGVMFFSDPVQAFANLRTAAKRDGQLRLIVWRGAADNPFMTTAERAAAPLLPNLPARQPNVPGQFAFGDPQRVRAILEGSGWNAIDLQPVDVTCAFPEKELARYVTRMGPVGRALADADDGTRAQIAEAIRPAFSPFVHGAEIRFTAAVWLVGAHPRG